MEIEYTAPQGVRDVIASLGRTEDVRFSPSNRRLAVAAFTRNRIVVFDIDIAAAATGHRVALRGGVDLSSPALKSPHGLDFIDDDTLVVSNREGDVGIFKLPAGDIDVQRCEALPIQTLPADGTSLLKSPGSVSIVDVDRDLCEMLICNNFEHTVTRHVLDRTAGCAVRSSEVLLRKWLDIPDGVGVSRDRRWIAVSNHNTHSVLLYEYVPSLNRDADPDGILRGVYYPHGLRFSSDGRHVFVADAGAPYVHVYRTDGDEWRGVRNPVATIRIMDESQFLRGRHYPDEGGPKGLDIDAGSNVLVVTSECQPLAFFDVPAMRDGELHERFQREQRALEVRYELYILEQDHLTEARARKAKTLLDYMTNSKSWRITAPFRRLHSPWRR